MPKELTFLQVAVDVVLFNIIHKQLYVLLVRRATPPYRDYLCLPGGLVKSNESVEITANKTLFRETWISCPYLKLFGVYSAVDRDPRGRIVSVGYYSIVANDSLEPREWLTQTTTSFFHFSEIGKLAFDHNNILREAYLQLQEDIQWSDIVKYFLPKVFTISQLKEYCEIIYNRTFEKRNFIKYIQSRFKIQKTKQKEKYLAHRPASLYKFVQ